MQVKQKSFRQFLPVSLEEAWGFFSRPENLNAITPDEMSFEILSDISGKPMYAGMIVRYKVTPFGGIKMNWVTEITHIKEQEYFIDEQRFGPYALWHHQHRFSAIDGGVEMEDILHYKVPYGIIGTVADRIFVDQKIEEIFAFRKKALERLFVKNKVEA